MPSFSRPFHVLTCACALVFSLQASAAPALSAAPEADARSDVILRLVMDRGWVPVEAAAQGVRQVRDSAADLVIMALNFLDLRYRSGGNTAEEGFDCSGFVRFIYQNSLGLVLPRRADEQASASAVVPVGRDELRPGDLVFFNTLRRSFSHVGIYIGDNKFIHSPRTGSSVRVEDMRKAYWTDRFNGARRVEALQAPQR